MKKNVLLTLVAVCIFTTLSAQKTACSDTQCRAFDFWVGNWEVFAKNGKKAGDSKISLILDSCVVLEEWTSANAQKGVIYKGKSFNTYNAASHQWQQTWVDNTGSTTEFLRGVATSGQIIFYADNVPSVNGKAFMRRLTFTKLNDNEVRQWGEKSDDNGQTWVTEYDLDYRRK
ncbi:MAG: hypothetical protein JST86_14790 [Bacteroidetes bacterium]|nr:hypothetical protein [Bacteroidota bacterium]